MRYLPFDWYQTPRYYDIVYDTSSEHEASFLEAAFDRHARVGRARTRRALEPACGTGRLLRSMARRGWQMTGFDLSEGMVALARQRCPSARLSRQAMQSFRAPRGGFELAFNLLSTFKHLLSERDARAHLRCVADALRPGGVYLLGLHLSEYGDPHRRRERWEAKRSGVHVVCNLQKWPADPRTRRENVRSRLKVTERGITRGYETRFQFRTYDVHELGSLLRSEKRLAHVASYGFDHDVAHPIDLWGDRLDFVLVLRRR